MSLHNARNPHANHHLKIGDDKTVAQGARQAAQFSVALLNVKYSPNLGDGIIAECLESELSRICPEWRVRSIDLAGRERYGSGLDAGRGWVLKLLDVLPQWLRRIGIIASLVTLIELRYRRVWRRQLAGVEGVIVGGGQLFADTDLNFPIKLHAALGEVLRAEAKVAIFGVGMAETLSGAARRLFLSALSAFRLAHVAVRDIASRDNWNRHFGRNGIATADLCHDPGLLAADVYPAGIPRNSGGKTQVGIGVVNPSTLGLHSRDEDYFSANITRDFWTRLARELLERGHGVTLFTNGPHDDERFLESVRTRIDDPRLKVMPRALVPQDLAEAIRSFDVVVARRLHANILAYAYRIPHVGLTWDPKMEAFFESVGRGRFLADQAQSAPGQLADLIEEALAEGIDASTHAAMIENTRAAIRACARDLATAMAEARTAV